MEFKTARGRLFISIFFILSLPFINGSLHIIDSAGLMGQEEIAKPHFSWKSWWNGSYQEQKEKYVTGNFGFHEDFVRAVNQLDFFLYKKINAGGIVMGSDHQLFYSNYIEEYCGLDYMGDSFPVARLTKLRCLQDTLEHLGKTVVFIFAPSKAYYYPDKIPDIPAYKKRGRTNYQNFRQIADALGIHLIDFNEWFASLKNKTAHPLFSSQGIHWTNYGSLLATDSLIRYIENKRDIHMPHPEWTITDSTQDARGTDNDLVQMLNLPLPFYKEEFYYPEVHYSHDANDVKPKAIYIGDSFLWGYEMNGLLANANRDAQIWYYFKKVYGSIYGGDVICDSMDKYDWPAQIQKADCIILQYTAPTLATNSDEFINKAYAYYFKR